MTGMSRPATPTRKTSSRRHFGHLKESGQKDARSSCGARDIGQAPHCAHFTNTSSTCSGDRSALIFLEPGTALDVPRRYAHRHAPKPEDGTPSAFTRRLGESSGRAKNLSRHAVTLYRLPAAQHLLERGYRLA